MHKTINILLKSNPGQTPERRDVAHMGLPECRSTTSSCKCQRDRRMSTVTGDTPQPSAVQAGLTSVSHTLAKLGRLRAHPSVRNTCTKLSTWSRYHGGRRPSGDGSLDSPTVIPPSALDKPSIMKRYHRRRTCSHTRPTTVK